MHCLLFSEQFLAIMEKSMVVRMRQQNDKTKNNIPKFIKIHNVSLCCTTYFKNSIT